MNLYWFLVLLCGAVSAIHPKDIADSDPTNYIFSETLDSNILNPSIGNGYVSTFLFSSQIFIGGLFNGFLNIAPSHRAVIPSPLNYQLSLSPGTSDTLQTDGYLFNIPMGNFSAFYSVLDSNNNTLANIQQTWYAHRAYRSLIVHEITVNNVNRKSHINFSVHNGLSEFSSPDIMFSNISPEGVPYSLYNGSIIQPESFNGEKVVVAVCTTKVSPHGNNYSIPAGEIFSTRYLTTFQTNIPGDAYNPPSAAETMWTQYNIISFSQLTESHKYAWNSIWSGLGIEVEGSSDALRLQQVTNTSLYWILSSIREDWPWSLSPGSLASNGYNGHTFWDTETWMYPTIMMLDTNLGKSILQYRINHAKGAQRKAKTYNPPYDGLMYPWEDAFSGYEVCPRGVATCRYEQHITGDISFAFRQYWDNTHDENWLRENYPVISNISLFWQSRVAQNGSVYDINDVIPPDEYAVGVNNSVYTNVVAKMSFQLAEIAAKVLGLTVPSAWFDIQKNLKIPFDDTRQIHLEYDGYTDEEIKQADVILLGFPLMFNMTKAIRANDLNYYSSVTDPNGPAMTWSMTAIGYIELGDYETAADYFTLGFANAQEPFQVWTETPQGGTVNFITGCGGFLQSMLFGYPNLRLHGEYISISRPILPANATSITLRNLDYRGGQLNIQYNSQVMNITLNNEANGSLFVFVLNSETPLEYLSPSLDTLLDRMVGSPSHLQVNQPFTTSVTNSLVIFSDTN